MMDINKKASNATKSEEGGDPVDDKHDNNTQHSTSQAQPFVIETKGWPPT